MKASKCCIDWFSQNVRVRQRSKPLLDAECMILPQNISDSLKHVGESCQLVEDSIAAALAATRRRLAAILVKNNFPSCSPTTD